MSLSFFSNAAVPALTLLAVIVTATTIAAASVQAEPVVAGYYHSSLTRTLLIPDFNATATSVVPTDTETTSFYMFLFERPAAHASDTESWKTFALMATPVCVAYKTFGESTPVSLTLGDLGKMLRNVPVTLSTSPATVTSAGWTLVLSLDNPSRLPLLAALRNHNVSDFSSNSTYPASVTGGAHIKWVTNEAAVVTEIRNNANHFGAVPLITYTELADTDTMHCMDIRVTSPWTNTEITTSVGLDRKDMSELNVKHGNPGHVEMIQRSPAYPLAGALMISINAKLSCGPQRIQHGILTAKSFLMTPPLTTRLGFLPLPVDRANLQLADLVNSTCPTFLHVQAAGSSAATRLLSLWSKEYLLHERDFYFSYWSGGTEMAVNSLKDGTYLINVLSTEWTDEDRKPFPHIAILPFAAFSVSIVFNLPGIAHLSIPLCAIGRIFNGQITMWNHPELVAANPTIQLPSVSINVVVRSGRSGLTEAFTDAIEVLEHKCSPQERSGITKTHTWSYYYKTTGASSSLVEQVVRQPYAIGFVSADSVSGPPLPEASLYNSTTRLETRPTPDDVRKAIAASTYNPAKQQLDLVIPSDAYPFFHVLYAAYNMDDSNKGRCETLKDSLTFFRWALSEEDHHATNLADNNGYVSLPSDLRARITEETLDTATCDGQVLFPKETPPLPLWVPLLLAAVALIAICVTIFFVIRWAKTRHAPKPGDAVFSTMFVVVDRAAHMWEVYSHAMPSVMRKFSAIVRAAASSCNCHIAKKIGDSYCIVSRNPSDLARCAADIQCAVQQSLVGDDIFFSGEEGQALLKEAEMEVQRKLRRAGGAQRGNMDTSEGSFNNNSNSNINDNRRQSSTQRRSSVSSEENDTGGGGGGVVGFGVSVSTAVSDILSGSINNKTAVVKSVRGLEARVHVNCGIRTHTGIVEQDHINEYYFSSAEHYEYSGAVVDQAALICDMCFPDQIVLCEQTYDGIADSKNNKNTKNTQGAVVDFGSFRHLGKRSVNKKDVELYQLNPAGLVPVCRRTALKGDRSFDNRDNSDSMGDVDEQHEDQFAREEDDVSGGIAVQLRAAKLGVTRRRATILIGHIIGLACVAKNCTAYGADDDVAPDAVRSAYTSLVGSLVNCANRHKGQVMSLHGGKIVVVFNAFQPTPSHCNKAAMCALELRETCKRVGGVNFDFCCGIATGGALCGYMFPCSLLVDGATKPPGSSSAAAVAHESTEMVLIPGEGFVFMRDHGSSYTTSAATTNHRDALAKGSKKDVASSSTSSSSSSSSTEMHRDVLGPCVVMANELAHRALANAQKDEHAAPRLLQLPVPISDIESSVYFEIVDCVVDVPDENTAAAAAVAAPVPSSSSSTESSVFAQRKRMLVVSLVSSKKKDQDDEKDQEWLYQVGEDQSRDPYAVANSMFKMILVRGLSITDRREFLHRLIRKVAEETGGCATTATTPNNAIASGNETEEELCSQLALTLPKSPGLRKLREILTHQGGIGSWLKSLQPLCSNL